MSKAYEEWDVYRLSTGDWDSFHRNEVNKIEVMEVEGCEILH